MRTSDETVRKLGKLAKLALTPEEIERFGEQAERIIGYFRTLQRLDLKGIEPTSHVVDVECFRRKDEPGGTLKCLENSLPYLKYGYFQVPRIIEESADERTPQEGG